MGITLSTFGGMLASLQSLMGWFAPARPQYCPASTVRRPGSTPAPTFAARAHSLRPAACTVRREVRRPLRVVRVVETSGAQASAGRMFMSGRMADVCAELDRLAALEATAH